MIWSRIALFFGFFSVLVAPWPGLNHTYGAWIRNLGAATLSWGHRDTAIHFEAIVRSRSRPLDTRIALVDTGHPLLDGNQSVKFLDLDMRGIGWVPTAFFTALVLVTPVPWKRRGRALAWGLCGMHSFILFSLWVHIMEYSGGGGGPIMGGLDETLINQIGSGFFASTFLWVVVMLRPEDWKRVVESRQFAQAAIPNQGVKFTVISRIRKAWSTGA
jgi:hypothetical protein